jgi:hypothetical protein
MAMVQKFVNVLAQYRAVALVGILGFLAGCSSPRQGDETATVAREAGGVSASYSGSASDSFSTASPPMNEKSAAPSAPAIIKTASLTVRAKKVEDAEKEAARTARRFGGFIAGSDGNMLASATPTVTLQVQIPQSKFADAIPAFEALGQRLEKAIHVDDVSTQLIDTDARLKSLSLEEASLNQMIGQARRLSDMITLRDRQSEIRTEIESLAAQQRNMRSRVVFSTLSFTLVQNPPTEATASDPGWFNVALSSAVQSAGELGRGIVVMLVNVAVFLPFWAIPAAVAFALYQRLRAKSL